MHIYHYKLPWLTLPVAEFTQGLQVHPLLRSALVHALGSRGHHYKLPWLTLPVVEITQA